MMGGEPCLDATTEGLSFVKEEVEQLRRATMPTSEKAERENAGAGHEDENSRG
eukprot:CAMPEP_0170147524 /NCGR_PEP_ID=MMETSP0033_2-20121228/34831_1 /TAXON_ID=195969 /ORGANISM="Dolichomastix tenuilepis, Strain CCMP3274" /LENGTH=52 /DNA_ID=CAMNT_0010384351 /DNA_START=64 /DNA_END=218 /DNA_ORIENTATION=-